MVKSLIVAFITLFFINLVWAEFPASINDQNQLTLEDFAYEAVLSDANSSLRQTVLPLSIYEKLSRRDHGDLRVFNSENQIVPHQFMQVAMPADTQQAQSLKFYPFNKAQASNPNNIRVIIKQTLGQQQLEINQQLNPQLKVLGTTNTAKNATKEQNEFQYIILNERADDRQKLCQLKLGWTQTKPSMILPLSLESSDDLQNWHSISRSLNVAKLNFSGSQLVNEALKFPCTTKKYLRLTWLKPEQNNHIKHISGFYTRQAKQIIETAVLGQPYYDSNGDLLFENNLNIGLSSMEFVSLDDSFLMKGKLYSRNNELQPWRFHQNIMQYRLAIAETKLNSHPFSFLNNRDRYWKLDLASEAQLSASQLPKIYGSWNQIKLSFLAQGKDPFKLAYGNPAVAPANNTGLAELIRSVNNAGSELDQVVVSHPKKVRELARIEKQTPWKQIGLWLFLLIGTAVLAYMAFSLYRQMDGNKKV